MTGNGMYHECYLKRSYVNSDKRPEAATLCMTPRAQSCTGTATDTSKTCDLDDSTDGTGACPAGCTADPGNTNPYVTWASQDSAWHGQSGKAQRLVSALLNPGQTERLIRRAVDGVRLDHGAHPYRMRTERHGLCAAAALQSLVLLPKPFRP